MFNLPCHLRWKYLGKNFCVVKGARLVCGKTKLFCVFEEEAETTSVVQLARAEEVAKYLLQLTCPSPLYWTSHRSDTDVVTTYFNDLLEWIGHKTSNSPSLPPHVCLPTRSNLSMSSYDGQVPLENSSPLRHQTAFKDVLTAYVNDRCHNLWCLKCMWGAPACYCEMC